MVLIIHDYSRGYGNDFKGVLNMCRFISFFHKPDADGKPEIAVWDLNSHGETEEHLKLNTKLWQEAHYEPNGNLELRYNDNFKLDKKEYEEIFKNRWVGILSSAIYVIFPMALVYDRMALYDSLVGAFAIWGLYFEILLIRNLRLDIALILGMVTGGAILTKTSGFFNIYLLPFTLLLFDLKAKKKLNRFAKWVGLVLISVFLAFGFYSVLRLSPFFHIINEKNSVFVYPFQELITHPFRFFGVNMNGVWDWLITYYKWSLFLLIISSFFISRKYTREKILLVIFYHVWFPGYVLQLQLVYPNDDYLKSTQRLI